jgi:hypothetical protein
LRRAWVFRRSYHDVEKKNGGRFSIEKSDKPKTMNN